ncbi:hypothetical protein BCR44DRAFT_1429332 [Catenaria anguillulae PL171]|uniref:Uncharacterized protein n=1 Tax=Catenaria anguillulae PL171 TaxID=765915 RepID=A0A1Y2HXU4_9FUNG|nr:hypothetical protein BCR44DRAFT_1429332 [Catenaria anguillulae PL171]
MNASQCLSESVSPTCFAFHNKSCSCSCGNVEVQISGLILSIASLLTLTMHPSIRTNLTKYTRTMSDQQQQQQSKQHSASSTTVPVAHKEVHPAAWSKALNQAENSERDSSLRHSTRVQDKAHKVAELVKQAEGGSQVQVQVTDDGIAVGNVKLQHTPGGKCELAHEHGSGCAEYGAHE